MPAPDTQPAYTVQRLRGGFALVWREGASRRRRQLAAQDRQSAEAEARAIWENSDDSPWTVGRVMQGYLASIAEKPSHQRRSITVYSVGEALAQNKRCQCTYRPETSNAE